MATTAQVTTCRELVMAYHAYERALQEFAAAANVRTGSVQRAVLREVCNEIDPREVDRNVTQIVIKAIKEA